MSLDDYEYNIETDYKSVGDFTSLKWSTDPPTVPGWYWVYNPKAYDNKIECLHILIDVENKPFDAASIDYGVSTNLSVISHWLGPLPVPEPPK